MPGEEHLGWGESELEEIIAVLELVYHDRSAAIVSAEEDSRLIAGLTWSQQMDQLAELLLPLLR